MSAIIGGAIIGGIAGAGTAIGVIGGIAAGVAVGSQVGSVVQQQKAAKAQEAAFRADQRRAEVQNVRAVRQQIRQARLAQGQMSNVAAQTGGLFGTGLAGGTSSVGSQLAGNLSYMSDIAQENTAIASAQMSSARAMSNAQLYGAVGNIAGTIFQGYTGKTVGQAIGAGMRNSGTTLGGD
jgi:hypothetical protein